MGVQRRADAIPIRPVAGIIYSPLSERARIAGTGIEVFEVVKTHRALCEDWEALRRAYHWLTEGQLQAALAFAGQNPEHVAARLAREDAARLEDLWAKHPGSAPPRA